MAAMTVLQNLVAPATWRSFLQSFRPQLRADWLLEPARAGPTMAPSSWLAKPLSSQTRRLSSSTTRGRAAHSPTTNRFSYSIAASYIAKDHPFDPSKHVFHFNPYNRVHHHPGKRKNKATRPQSGQDAFFVSRVGQASGGAVALGVADGVGGWMDSGVDPADFSHGLCDYAAAVAYGYNGKATAGSEDRGGKKEEEAITTELTARQVMQGAYDAVCRDPAIPAGGSTAVVGLLGEDGTLEVANLGDSGFIHLRPDGVRAHSDPQTHAFNTPYQLSAIPPSVMLRVATFGGAQLSDLPADADVSRHSLRHGDVLVFATDGVWDNLFDQDVVRVVRRAMTLSGAWLPGASGAGGGVAPDLEPLTRLDGAAPGAPATLQAMLATGIVGAAKAASVNTRVDGPFAKEVKKYYPLDNWRGGKVDDICVVVVVVSEAQDRPPKAHL